MQYGNTWLNSMRPSRAPIARAAATWSISRTTRTEDRASRAVRNALDALPDEDRMLIRFRFGSSMSIADISRILRLPQRPLYRRIETLLARLRRVLGDAGVDAGAVSDLIGSPVAEMQFGLAEWKNGDRQQSSFEERT